MSEQLIKIKSSGEIEIGRSGHGLPWAYMASLTDQTITSGGAGTAAINNIVIFDGTISEGWGQSHPNILMAVVWGDPYDLFDDGTPNYNSCFVFREPGVYKIYASMRWSTFDVFTANKWIDTTPIGTWPAGTYQDGDWPRTQPRYNSGSVWTHLRSCMIIVPSIPDSSTPPALKFLIGQDSGVNRTKDRFWAYCSQQTSLAALPDFNP